MRRTTAMLAMTAAGLVATAIGVGPAGAEAVAQSDWGGYAVSAEALGTARMDVTVPRVRCDKDTVAYTVFIGLSGRLGSGGAGGSPWSAAVRYACDASGHRTTRAVIKAGGGPAVMPVRIGDLISIKASSDTLEIDDQTRGRGMGTGFGPDTVRPAITFGAHTTAFVGPVRLPVAVARMNGQPITDSSHQRLEQVLGGQVVVQPTVLAADGTFTLHIR